MSLTSGILPRMWLPTALVLGLMACGCGTRPIGSTAQPPTMSGRLAVRVEAEGNSPANALSASFELDGDEQRGQLRLVSPLGIQLALARWGAEGVELITSEGTRRFTDLTALAEEALGVALPLGALLHWLDGQPWPGAPSEPLPSEAGFKQLGWTVNLARFADSAQVDAAQLEAPAISVRARIDRPTP